MTVNAENILKVADAIERHTISWLGFNMRSWYADEKNGTGYPDQSGHKCGTVACVAGWATVVELGEEAAKAAFDAARPDRKLITMDLLSSPEEFLGINDEQAEALFYGADSDEGPDQAVRTLRHLAETGEVDWSI